MLRPKSYELACEALEESSKEKLWSVAEPGRIEADTVAHCGGSMSGNVVWMLMATDILRLWTEVRSMWNWGATATFERLREILPPSASWASTRTRGQSS